MRACMWGGVGWGGVADGGRMCMVRVTELSNGSKTNI